MTLGIGARYALYAVLELARGATPVSVASIAHRHRIPETALAKVFQRLVRSGLVVGVRGPRGGYRLARPARHITVLEVMTVFELAPPVDAGVTGGPAGNDVLGDLLGTMDGQVRSAFASITIDRLVVRGSAPM